MTDEAIDPGAPAFEAVKVSSWRFAAAYLALGLIITASIVGSIGAAYVWWGLPHIPTKSDLAQIEGDQNLGKLCQAATISAIQASYGTVHKVTTVSVTHTGLNDAKATVSVSSSVYNGPVTCSYHKSSWQQTGLAPGK